MSTTPVVVDMTWPIYASDFTFRRHVALFRDLPPLIVPLAAANARTFDLFASPTDSTSLQSLNITPRSA